MYELDLSKKNRRVAPEPEKIPAPQKTRKAWGWIRGVFVVCSVISLSTVAIYATDTFDFGSDRMLGSVFMSQEDSGPCPEGMAYVPSSRGGYCIDKFEASPSEECVYSNPMNQEETRANLETLGCKVESKEGKTPWRYISQNQAMNACAQAGKYLPDNEEWYQAAQGTPHKSSGWGAQDCNVAGNWNTGDDVGLTGQGSACRSSFEVFDMVGNAWEWTSDTVQNGTYDGRDLPESGFVYAVDKSGVATVTEKDQGDENHNNDRFWINDAAVTGFIRGGFWGNRSDAGIYASHVEMPTSFAGRAVSFRCATQPQN